MLRLDQKLQNIRAGRYKRSDFIIADAKDSDAGAGVTCSGFDYAGLRPATTSDPQRISRSDRSRS